MIAKNIFSGGRVLDVDPNSIQPDTYVEAHNVELVGDNKFFALKNIKGTTEIDFIKDAEILAVYETFYKIDTTENVKCLTVITVNESTFNIFCYDLENETLYEMYEEATQEGYLTDDRIIDARAYAENGIDVLYFTDDFNEIRQLRCEIPSGYSANFLSEFDLSLQRWGSNGIIEVGTDCVLTGGSLLSGTYQFAYRMCDPDNKKFTKWSSLTNPIHVYGNSTSGMYVSGYGFNTNRKIRIDVNPSAIELDNFDYFQLAVIENVYPSGAFSENNVFYASLLPIEATANRTNYEYKSNYKIGNVSIDELTVDYSAIQSAKTLAVNKNRLFAGNITYKNLEFDNSPTVTGTIATNAEVFTDIPASRRKGYFRGEVYRFGVVYFDKYGNKSPVHVLDMSSITGNQISGATDMKFPSRSTSNSYSILNGSNVPRSLGLSLTVDNHPTWAVGFEIVREERIKRILFQSPVVPYTTIKGIGAFYNYPSSFKVNGDLEESTSSDAQPMTADEVYVPKNLMWPEMRKVSSVTTTGSSGFNKRYKGEAKLERNLSYNICALYPQTIFEGKGFELSGSEILDTVDYTHLKVDAIEFDLGSYPEGDYLDNNSSASFFATAHGQYFFDNAWSAKSISSTNQITDSLYLDNYQEGTSFSGTRLNKFEDLATDGYGNPPNTQRSLIVKLADSWDDEGAEAINFAVGNHNAYSGGSPISGASSPNYESNYTNESITGYTGYTGAKYIQVIRIVNCVNPSIGDTRYGDVDSQRLFISTGAKYTFSGSEITDVENSTSTPITLDVWGGDCFISSHTFKVTDSTYAVVNNQKNYTNSESSSTLFGKWDRKYGIPTDFVDPWTMMPVPLKGNSQFIQVYLESEYNNVMDNSILSNSTVIGNSAVMVQVSETLNRTSLTYNYNANINKNNSQKVYLVKPDISFEQFDFNARIHYTDLKLYNSSEAGFDAFRVANYFDQEESGGAITKLCVANDNLYSVQERRISYLPVGERLLEATDASIISVGTSDVLSDARIIDQSKGGQHLGAIVEEGGFVIIPDVRNKSVYVLSGQELISISDKGNSSLFRSLFGNFSGRHLRGMINPVRKEYWLFDNGNFCHVFNYSIDKWVANYEFTTLQHGIYANQNLYLIDNGTLYTMYTGEVNNLSGVTVVPRASFFVNPEPDFSKTFDNQMFVSTDRLNECDYVVYRETALGNQTVNSTTIDVSPVENNYRIKTLRDEDGARLRGVRLKTTVKWGSEESTLSSVITKWRASARRPY